MCLGVSTPQPHWIINWHINHDGGTTGCFGCGDKLSCSFNFRRRRLYATFRFFLFAVLLLLIFPVECCMAISCNATDLSSAFVRKGLMIVQTRKGHHSALGMSIERCILRKIHSSLIRTWFFPNMACFMLCSQVTHHRRHLIICFMCSNGPLLLRQKHLWRLPPSRPCTECGRHVKVQTRVATHVHVQTKHSALRQCSLSLQIWTSIGLPWRELTHRFGRTNGKNTAHALIWHPKPCFLTPHWSMERIFASYHIWKYLPWTQSYSQIVRQKSQTVLVSMYRWECTYTNVCVRICMQLACPDRCHCRVATCRHHPR